MKAFFAQYPEAGAGARARQEALENVQNNIRWIANYKKVLGDWLESNGFNS
jgi:glutamyl aminopeptidase